MKRRCPKCGGAIWRVGNGERPYYCNNCKVRFTEPEVAVPSTNGDGIRSMTDEELSEWCVEHFMCPEVRPWCETREHGEIRDCKKCWLDWLKQEKNK